ncbi:unnamed protein product [Boreogadus saida]
MMRNQPVHSSSAIYCSPHGPTIHPSTKQEEQAEVVVEEEEESSEKMETEGLSWEKEEKEKSDEVGISPSTDLSDKQTGRQPSQGRRPPPHLP